MATYDDEDPDVWRHLGHLAPDIVEGPLLGGIDHEDHGVRALHDVDGLGVEAQVAAGGAVGRHGRHVDLLLKVDAQRSGLAFGLALVDHIPHLDLDRHVAHYTGERASERARG